MTSTYEASRILDGFFNRFDGNMDDVVTREEIEKALVAEGAGAATAAAVAGQMLANWDADSSGSLTKGEVIRLAEKWASFPGDQNA